MSIALLLFGEGQGEVGGRAANQAVGDKTEQEKNATAMKRRRSANQAAGDKTGQVVGRAGGGGV